MASSKGSQNVRNLMYPGKHALLPPKIPFSSLSTSCTEYIPSSLIGSKAVQKPREEKAHHQRTSSESHLIEEQPFWLDDLLNEPESPVHKPGHRRSSSDSFAYLDAVNISNIGHAFQNDNRFVPRRGTQEFYYNKDSRDCSFYSEANSLKQKWESMAASGAHPNFFPSTGENGARQNSGPSFVLQEAERISGAAAELKNPVESVSQDPSKMSPEKRENSDSKPETDNTKRAKQQFAQRSRVRKLQYIAELERNVQALQAEGSEFSAELEFLNQQNLILSMENKALKQRLESLAQEKLIKRLEHEVLEREIGRLRALYQQQQQKQEQPQQQKQSQKPSPNHRRTSSKDLDLQFANLSLKSKDSNSAPESTTGQLHG